MKYYNLFFAWTILAFPAFSQNSDSLITLNFTDAPLYEILDAIEQQSLYSFAFDKKKIPYDKTYSVQANQQTIHHVAKKLFEDDAVNVKFIGHHVSLAHDESESFTWYGQVQEFDSGEVIPFANIIVVNKDIGTSNNENGYFSLSLKTGKYVINTSSLGYFLSSDTLLFNQNLFRNIILKPDHFLDSVIISATKVNRLASNKDASIVRDETTIDKANKLMSTAGIANPLGIAVLQPGFSSLGLNSNAVVVRGGELGQNLILLDDIPLYIDGTRRFSSAVFRGQAMQHMGIHTKNIPTYVGDRAASVMDIRLKEGNRERTEGFASFGFYDASVSLQGPIKKKTGSYFFTARRTWPDLVIPKAYKRDGLQAFADLHAKLNYDITDRDKVLLSLYAGNDKSIEDYQISPNRIQWLNAVGNQRILERKDESVNNNLAIGLKWQRILRPNLFMKIGFQYSHNQFIQDLFERYETIDSVQLESLDKYDKSSIDEKRAFVNFDYHPSPKHHVSFGVQAARRTIEPGVLSETWTTNGVALVRQDAITSATSTDWNFYLEHHFKLNKFDLDVGLRATHHKTENKNYFVPLGRFQLQYNFADHQSIALSLDQFTQHLHLLSTASYSDNNTKWFPSNEKIKPTRANQLDLTYERKFKRSSIILSTYYKKLSNMLFLDSSISDFDSFRPWEDQFQVGQGTSYGLEMGIKKSIKRWQFSAAYTLSNSTRKYPDIANGNAIKSRFHQPHIFNLTANYDWKTGSSSTHSLGLIWSLASGGRVTLPSGVTFDSIGNPIPIIDEIHNFKTPDLHQLNLSYVFKRVVRKKNMATWRFGIANVYGRDSSLNYKLIYQSRTSSFNLRNFNYSPLVPFAEFQYSF